MFMPLEMMEAMPVLHALWKFGIAAAAAFASAGP
jgi:hypothetical protein